MTRIKLLKPSKSETHHKVRSDFLKKAQKYVEDGCLEDDNLVLVQGLNGSRRWWLVEQLQMNSLYRCLELVIPSVAYFGAFSMLINLRRLSIVMLI